MHINIKMIATFFVFFSLGIFVSLEFCERYIKDLAYNDLEYTRKHEVKEDANRDDVVARYKDVSSDDLRENADVSDEDWEQHRDTVITD